MEKVYENSGVCCGETIDRIISQLRNNSSEHLKTASDVTVNTSQKLDFQICPYDRCTGCFACMNKCPKNAISCVVDNQGRTVPQIDSEKCIQCGLCQKVCPQIHEVETRMPIKCFAAQRTDSEERAKSASGGVAAVLAEWMIEQGGVVYGAAVRENGTVCHVRAETLEQIAWFRRSKYVQSYIGYTYQQVRKDLEQSCKVLFTGTPCQIAGLKKFLGKMSQSNLLICVDIICHGVPPIQYLKEHIRSVVGEKSFSDITFRGGKLDYHLVVHDGNRIIYDVDKNHDLYYYSFLKSYICRENCYSCKYAKAERCSDLTIGDFWGVDRKTLTTRQIGRISVILVNTEKGREAVKQISTFLSIEERLVSEAVEGNSQLRHPALQPPQRKKFIDTYKKTGNFEISVIATGVKKKILIEDIKRSQFYTTVRCILKGKGK